MPDEGDIIRYVGKHGIVAGSYIRTNRRGNIEIQVPELGNRIVKLKPEQVIAVRPRQKESDA